MSEFSSVQKVMGWITMVLALAFILIGVSVVSGILLPQRVFLEGTLRYVLGFVLIGYGIIRIIMIGRKLKSEKRQKPFAEKT
jgi:cytochrome b561